MNEAHRSRPLVGPKTMPVLHTGWWEQNRAELIRTRISDLTDVGDVIIDVGCGRGTMLVGDAATARTVINVDGHIWDEWEPSAERHFVCAHADALPFRDGAFDLVGSFDMLEHLPDDHRGLAEQKRIARRGGHVVTALPADERLWSNHDVQVGHHRRYTRRSFATLASDVGLQNDRTTYFYSFLWLPARLLRSSKSRGTEPAISESFPSRMVRGVLSQLARLERALIARRPIPFGTSLWAESRVR